RVAGAGQDVLDERRPRGGPVRSPELRAVGPVVGQKEERPGDVHEEGGGRGPAGVYVLDQLRPRWGPVRSPELYAVGVVVGPEEERPSGVREGGGTRGAAAGPDVLDEARRIEGEGGRSPQPEKEK